MLPEALGSGDLSDLSFEFKTSDYFQNLCLHRIDQVIEEKTAILVQNAERNAHKDFNLGIIKDFFKDVLGITDFLELSRVQWDWVRFEVGWEGHSNLNTQ
jgi:hypothetical protein